MITENIPATSLAPRPLEVAEIRQFAPSVFAPSARPGVSSRYTFVSTADVVALLGDAGWLPVQARQQRARSLDRAPYTTHELRFARRDDLRVGAEVGSVRPELILQNAHDGSRAYRIDAGLHRLVCRNGLVVADALFAHVAIRHVDVAAGAFLAAAQAVIASTPATLETVARWQGVALSDAAREEFARRARALRWDAVVAEHFTPEMLLAPLRHGDHGTDLWTTFNVVQEHLLRGGDRYRVDGRNRTTRPLGAIRDGGRVNKALWALAETFSRN